MEEINKCELVDCWFYIDHTPPKGQGTWGGAIHKGACKLNSTDCKDISTERCLVKSLYKQLKRKEKECEELKEKLKTLDDSVITYELTESDFKKYNKLKQALQEIKEICYDNIDYGCRIDCIIEIISEAENG